MKTLPNTTDGHTPGPDTRPVACAELLDVRAVAAMLGGCSKRHIYRLSDAGRMPGLIKLGSLVRWRRVDLEAWIGAGCPTQSRGGQRR